MVTLQFGDAPNKVSRLNGKRKFDVSEQSFLLPVNGHPHNYHNRSNIPLGRTRKNDHPSNMTAGDVRVDQKTLKTEHLIPWNWKERKANLVHIATVPTQMMMSLLAHRLETSLKSSYREKCSFPRTPQEEWMTKLRSFGRNSSTKTREEHETPNENLSHQARSDQCICEN